VAAPLPIFQITAVIAGEFTEGEACVKVMFEVPLLKALLILILPL
jgi:hypothetical protein